MAQCQISYHELRRRRNFELFECILFLQSIIVKILSKPYSSANKGQNRHKPICITVGKVMTGQPSVFSFEIST